MNVKSQPRDYDMMEWLLHEKFSFLEELAHVFFKKGVNPQRAPYRRLLKLMDQGLVATRKVYHDPRDLYVATHKSTRLLRSIGFQYVPALSKDKKFVNFDHDYTLIKLRIMAHDIKLGVWVPERVIRSIKPHGGCPDALLMTADAHYAVEYEYSEKEMERYKRIFDYYATQTNYDGVLYILRTEARIEKVREKIPYIDSKIYFISEEDLFQDPEGAVFMSSKGELSMKDLLSMALG